MGFLWENPVFAYYIGLDEDYCNVTHLCYEGKFSAFFKLNLESIYFYHDPLFPSGKIKYFGF